MKYKLHKNCLKTAVFGLAFVATLSGCGANTVENKVASTTDSASIEKNYADEFDEYIDEKKESDSAMEAALSIMLDGKEKLEDSASEAANSEEVKESFNNSMQNFRDLKDFISGDKEINGISFDDLSDEMKDKVIGVRDGLDNTLESIHPNYKEDFKEWFTDKAASALDKLSDLKDSASDLWDEIQSKRKTK